jgi:UDP-glucose 4-epimerase
MKRFLITGGSGFFGTILKNRLLDLGHSCVNIDLETDDVNHPHLISIQGDIRNRQTLETIFSQHQFDAIFHCAAILAHEVKDDRFLWTSNVDGTRNIADFAEKYLVQKVIFTSSNCLWAKNFHRLVTEKDAPAPIEIYGKSKLEGERILLEHSSFNSIIFRCPTIIDEGRLGLLSILFEFMDENRKIWLVGKGNNRYQFIYAKDLANACIKSLSYDGTEIFNIGSSNVKSFREVYEYVIKKSGSRSKVASIPKSPTIFAMKAAHFLKLSPLGPYQYKMIAEDFIFDTTKITQKLNWQPTLTNEEMLYKSYEYYRKNKQEIYSRTNVAAHKKPAKMGIIKLLKWFS